MTALTKDRGTVERANKQYGFPAAAGSKGFAGGIVCLNAAGFATKGATATTLKTVGMAEEGWDNTGGADGALTVRVRRGLFSFANSAGGDAITRAAVGTSCYLVDDQTVALTSGSSTRSVAGIVRDVDAGGVWVEI